MLCECTAANNVHSILFFGFYFRKPRDECDNYRHAYFTNIQVHEYTDRLHTLTDSFRAEKTFALYPPVYDTQYCNL